MSNERLLRRHRIIGALPEGERERIVRETRVSTVAAQEVVLQGNTAPDGLLIVLSGRVQVFRERADGSHEELAERGAGQIIGEMSLMTGLPRSASVRALRNTIIGTLAISDHSEAVERFPHLMQRLSHVAVLRAMGRDAPPPRSVALLLAPLHDGLPMDELLDGVAAELGAVGRVRCFRSGDWNQGLEQQAGIQQAELSARYVVYVGDAAATDWNRWCLGQVDRIVRVADARASPALVAQEAELFEGTRLLPRQHLLLLHPADTASIQGTAAWLDPRPDCVLHHHVRQGTAADLGRATRLVVDRAVGVVFSGASSRGVAHIGMVRALADLGVPIDIVAGNSSGGLIGCMTAAALSPADMQAGFLDILECSRLSWRTATLPVLSFMNGRRVGQALQRCFGAEQHIEDLLIPCVMTAVDLNENRVVNLDRGPAWLAARATCSLPGYWPPVAHGGRVLVDGGVMVNLPLETIETYCRDGRLLACDLDVFGGQPARAFDDLEQYGDQLSGWRLLWRKLFASTTYPSMVQLFAHTMCLTSYNHQRELAYWKRHPHIDVLYPPVEPASFFDVDASMANDLVNQVYDHATEELSSLAASLRPAQDRGEEA